MQKHRFIEQSYISYNPHLSNQLKGISCILYAHLLAACRAALTLGNDVS